MAFKDEGPVDSDCAGMWPGMFWLYLFPGPAPRPQRRTALYPTAGCALSGIWRRPGRPLGANDPIAVTLRPRQIVQPVGSVVVLVAGVLAGDGYLRTNERLEWSIAPCSVGRFVDVQHNGWVDLLLGDFNSPHKVSNVIAVGSTSREYVRLNGGPLGLASPVCVLRGEAWVTVSSPLEGISRVAALRPGVVPCDRRVQEAMMYWINAQFDTAACNNPAGGRHVICTTACVRDQFGACMVGWIVRC